jgi:hypothetical protein
VTKHTISLSNITAYHYSSQRVSTRFKITAGRGLHKIPMACNHVRQRSRRYNMPVEWDSSLSSPPARRCRRIFPYVPDATNHRPAADLCDRTHHTVAKYFCLSSCPLTTLHNNQGYASIVLEISFYPTPWHHAGMKQRSIRCITHFRTFCVLEATRTIF